MSKLLLDEHPLMVMPKLAKVIGLNEAIILQQIHYWNEINKKTNNNFKDGYYWTFNSYDGWCEQFPFWSESTIKRAMRNLEKTGVVIVGNYNKLKIDRTKWYRIDYKTLEKWDNIPIVQNDLINGSNCTEQKVKMGRPLPESKTETTAETKLLQAQEIALDDEQEKFIDSLSRYTKKRFGKPLRKVNDEACIDFSVYKDLDEYEIIDMLDRNITNYNQCNLNYLSSISERIRCNG